MKKAFIILVMLAVSLSAGAQQPLYIVNGQEHDEIASIPPADIEHTEMLPADDETIAKYGERAANGVMFVTLRYDTPAMFAAGQSFNDYIASRVKWPATEPAARIVLRYTITPKGLAIIDKELESTDSRLRRRVLKAFEQSPLWQPALRKGMPVESEGVLHVQLPAGKPMPRQVELIWR